MNPKQRKSLIFEERKTNLKEISQKPKIPVAEIWNLVYLLKFGTAWNWILVGKERRRVK